MTKPTLCAVAIFAALSLPAIAGGISEPIMEPTIVVAEAASSSANTAQALPILIFGLLLLCGLSGS
jgi:hypothetical protein